MTRFRLWWEAMDAVLIKRGQKPLSYEEARLLHDCELEPGDVAACLRLSLTQKETDDADT